MSEQLDGRLAVMKNAPPFKAIIKLSVPVIMGMLVNVAYNLADTFFIGLLGDEHQMAAASVSMPVFIVMMALASLIGTGGASFLSRSLGAGHNEKAKKTLVTCLLLMLVFGAVVAVVGLLLIRHIPNLLGATGYSYGYTRQYVSVLIIGGVFTISNFALGQLIRAEGSVMASMAGMLMGLLLSISLDPLFIFVFNWGVTGSAVATVIGNAASAAFFLSRYLRRKTVVRLSIKQFSFDKEIFREIFTIGIPVTLGQMLVSLSQMLGNNIAGSYGDTYIASLGIAMRVMTIGTFVFMGFGAGCQPLMGYNYGEGNFDRLLKLIKTALVMSTVLGAVLAAGLWLSSGFILHAFSPSYDVHVMSASVLRVLVLSLPFMGGITLCSITFQAMGKPIRAFIITVSRQGLLFIPLLFTLNSFFAFRGMVFAQPIADFIMIIISAIFLIVTIRGIAKAGSIGIIKLKGEIFNEST